MSHQKRTKTIGFNNSLQQRRFLFLLCLYANLLMPATHIGIQYRYTAVQSSCPRARISIWQQGCVNLKGWALYRPTYIVIFIRFVCWSIFESLTENDSPTWRLSWTCPSVLNAKVLFTVRYTNRQITALTFFCQYKNNNIKVEFSDFRG